MRIRRVHPTGRIALAALVAFALSAAACGGDEASAPTNAPRPDEPGTSPAPAATAAEPTAADRPAVPPGDPDITFEWTRGDAAAQRIGDQIFATSEGFISFEFPLSSGTRVSNNGLEWVGASAGADVPAGELEATEITNAGPGYDFGMNFDNHAYISADGFTWIRHDLDLEEPDLGAFHSLDIGPLVVGRNDMVLVGRMNRSNPDEHAFFVWASDDGDRWDLVADAFAPGTYIDRVLPFGSGFITHGFIEGSSGGGRLWFSADGRTWEEHPDGLDSDSSGIADRGLAVWGDRVVAADVTDGGMRLWQSDDGRAWEPLNAALTLEDPQQELRIESIHAGPAGILVLADIKVTPLSTPEPPSVLEKEGLTLSIEYETRTLVVSDPASGEILVEADLFEVSQGSIDGVVVDESANTLTVTRPDTGDIVTFSGEEIQEAHEKALAQAGIDPGFEEVSQRTPVLWFSPDGTRWATIDIPPELERSDGVPLWSDVAAVVGNDAVILRWQEYRDFEDTGEDPQVESDEEPLEVVWWVGRLGRS